MTLVGATTQRNRSRQRDGSPGSVAGRRLGNEMREAALTDLVWQLAAAYVAELCEREDGTEEKNGVVGREPQGGRPAERAEVEVA